MEQLQRILIRRPVILQLLRFAAIGVLNTALDFIILNFVSKTLGIESGFKLGTINVAGVVLALVQSYYWNRYWAFNASAAISVVKEFWRLVVVGGIGTASIIAVLLGANAHSSPIFYLIVLAIFLAAEASAWFGYKIGQNATTQNMGGHHQFGVFVLVSIIGVLINSTIIAFVSYYLIHVSFLHDNADLLKNAAKILATGISLIWNFFGYKLIVFKK